MKLLRLLKGDLYFQYKYGFYFLYTFFTVVYIVILYFLPRDWQQIGRAIIIFSDPALIGLIFIGAIILFEKSERVLHSLSIAPIHMRDYLLSKIISITCLSLASGLTIGLASAEIISLVSFVGGLLFGSIFFSLLGLIIGFKASTLNNALIYIFTTMIISFLPIVAYYAGIFTEIMRFTPSIAIVECLMNEGGNIFFPILILISWIIPTYIYALKVVHNSVKRLGGALS